MLAELTRRNLRAIPKPNAAPLTFRQFVSRVRPSFVWYEHCERLAAVLQRVVDGELPRLMVFCPPRHGKSELASRLFTAYYLYRHPERFVGLTSYAADLAYTLSRASRENFKASGRVTRSDADAVKQWETPEGGGLWAAGVGGPITGKGGHLLLIDDPTKNAEDAASETLRAKEREWYSSTFYTRAEPDAAVVVIQTRWHEEDLSGWLLSQEGDEDTSPERWHVVDFPAIALESAAPLPATCTREADWRRPGEALCPPRYGVERLRAIEHRIGEYHFGALFQQRPTPREGSFFKPANIVIADAAPAPLRTARAWDMAASVGKGDYTAGAKVGTDGQGRFWILDIARGQWGPDEADKEIRQVAALDGTGVPIRLPQDPGAAGKRDAAALVRMLAGYAVEAERVSGSKEVRARAFASQVNAGNVSMLRAPWNAAVLNEMRTFPLGAHDDMIDALSDAFEALALPRVGVPAAESRANPAAAYGQQVTPHTLATLAPPAYGGYRPR